MNRFEFIAKCFYLFMLVLPNSAFADCCCMSGACDTHVRVEVSSGKDSASENSPDSESSQPPCACCASEEEQPSCCLDFADDCRDCDCCGCSIPAETIGILAAQNRPVEAAVCLPSIETMPIHGGATFDFPVCGADFIPISHRQRQAWLSVWRN